MPITSVSAPIRVGFASLRSNPLRTFLSTLGVIMGVASLVAVLAVGDGVEKFARSVIERSTDLQSIVVASRTTDQVDGVQVPRDTVLRFGLGTRDSVAVVMGTRAQVSIRDARAAEVSGAGIAGRRAALVFGTVPEAEERLDPTYLAGRFITEAELRDSAMVAVISQTLAEAMATDPKAALGQQVILRDSAFVVVGVMQKVSEQDRRLTALVPFTVLNKAAVPGSDDAMPTLVVRARKVEDVGALRTELEQWLRTHVGLGEKSYEIQTSAADQLAQARQGILVFKLALGTFAGIALLVGGIGIMNVLLSAVIERTREIGIRKAVGATQGDIMVQFLAESVAIAFAGALVGTVLGLAGAFGATALMRHITEAPVHAAFRLSSIAVAALIAITIGLVFGSYPALRAARLSPIDAIRHE
jgi:putative ABC transport system permease protein